MLSPAGREPCQHCLQNPLARQDDQCPGEQLDAVGCNCVAFCVAVGHDPLISRATPRLFGSCPRHFTQARPSWPGLACFVGPPSRRAVLSKPGHLRSRQAFSLLVRGILPLVIHGRTAIHGQCGLFFCAASCRGPVSVSGASFEEPAAA